MHTPALYMYVTVNTSVWICVSVDACPFSLCVNMCEYVFVYLCIFSSWLLRGLGARIVMLEMLSACSIMMSYGLRCQRTSVGRVSFLCSAVLCLCLVSHLCILACAIFRI